MSELFGVTRFWFGAESSVRRPTAFNSCQNRGMFKAKIIGPLRHCKRLACIGKANIRSHVILLFSGEGPFAVLRCVVAVVVDALQACSSGSFAHIGKKVLKDAPTSAKPNASAEIIFATARHGVCAAGSHGVPRAPSRGVAHAVCGVRLGNSRRRSFFPIAAARLGVTRTEIVTRNDGIFATGAPARPCKIPAPDALLFDNKQASESLPTEINAAAH